MCAERRVVLVTGATGSLGRAVAARFAATGACLALAGTDAGRLEALVSGLAIGGDRSTTLVADLRDRAATRRAIAETEARFGRIDVAAHLVGGWAGGTAVADLDHDEVRSMLDQHLWTTLNVAQAVIPGMVERGFGRILAVTTPFAANPSPRSASYTIAKAAEEVLLRTVARETAGTGVTANLVVVRKIDEARERETAPAVNNATWATPDEIADTLVFLASPAARAITGARVPLDGRGR